MLGQYSKNILLKELTFQADRQQNTILFWFAQIFKTIQHLGSINHNVRAF